MNGTELSQLRLPQLAVVQPAPNNEPIPSSPAQDTEQPITNTVEQHLAPTDGGIAAWRLLMAAFVFETLLWGFPLSFGVFQDHYSRTPEFADNPYIPVVGTVASGLGYLGAPVMMLVIQRFPQYRQYMIWIGCMCLAFLDFDLLHTLEYSRRTDYY